MSEHFLTADSQRISDYMAEQARQRHLETYRQRQEELAAVLRGTRPLIEEASTALQRVWLAEQSTIDRSADQAALAMLDALSTCRQALHAAQTTLAADLVQRGVSTASIARAAHVSRATVGAWVERVQTPPHDGH